MTLSVCVEILSYDCSNLCGTSFCSDLPNFHETRYGCDIHCAYLTFLLYMELAMVMIFTVHIALTLVLTFQICMELAVFLTSIMCMALGLVLTFLIYMDLAMVVTFVVRI